MESPPCTPWLSEPCSGLGFGAKRGRGVGGCSSPPQGARGQIGGARSDGIRPRQPKLPKNCAAGGARPQVGVRKEPPARGRSRFGVLPTASTVPRGSVGSAVTPSPMVTPNPRCLPPGGPPAPVTCGISGFPPAQRARPHPAAPSPRPASPQLCPRRCHRHPRVLPPGSAVGTKGTGTLQRGAAGWQLALDPPRGGTWGQARGPQAQPRSRELGAGKAAQVSPRKPLPATCVTQALWGHLGDKGGLRP